MNRNFAALLLAFGLSSSLAMGQTQFAELAKQHLPKDSDFTNVVVMGDVDGDGDLDLVFGNFGQNRLYLNDGKGKFTDATASRLPKDSDFTWAAALGDVDGDGDLDLVFGNIGSIPAELNRLYLNDGKGKFSDATASRLPRDNNDTFAVALGDVDGDGDLDLVLTTHGQNRLYLNLHRHVYAPLQAQLGKPYQLDFYAKPGYGKTFHVVVPLVASGEMQIPVPPYGMFGLDPAKMVLLPLIYLAPRVGGKTSIRIQVPNNQSLIGKTAFSQALILDPIGPSRFTNVVADKIVK